ncbi:polyhydroxyalkanoate depolymerase, intracellular [Enhydrobacter aerosaccus]|uniref:Polyhydroxyalkanoate depolymerase, intracellular n=1 Tax=Enhydrobacter aerosaccus TaxID=225324 RepID=A0A1T4T1K9_9HYPH|nr:polyhydroxyalkanoate depolymerase [Enhydrobacter aerosaccus]SKA34335.1 polyhydroxyalkanoate depolymerase, intracellular [Enhydrobacter aerosaccus]
MLYAFYQTATDITLPMRIWATAAGQGLGLGGEASVQRWRAASALCEMMSRAVLSHRRPAFGIEEVKVGKQTVPVREEEVMATPFGTLLRFVKEGVAPQPKVLVVAPLSGHFATLLRDTVRVLLPEHDVHITDWANARDVAIWSGRFGFDEYVEHLILFLEAMGPASHVVAVCQPCVQALAAAAIMAEDDHPAQPHSLTLMAGPIDTRINPTKVNELATGRPISWFEQNLIARVPLRYPGATRRVYPGFLQLTAFMSMNLERHLKAHVDLYNALARGDEVQANTIKTFYDEYFAVLDMTAEFYLETVQWVFQEFRLAKGELDWKGRRVDPKAIRRTALFTVEGERDDICAIGQTVAAHDLCASLRPYRKKHYMQAGVGHYGVFAGKRWASQIYPLVRNTILANE